MAKNRDIIKIMRKLLFKRSTAPVIGEAGIIAQNAHGIEVVCGYDVVNKKQLINTKMHLTSAGAKTYGVVANR